MLERPLSNDDLAAFFRMLGSHLDAGVSPAAALACLADEMPGRAMRKLAGRLASTIGKGMSLDAAFAAEHKRWGPVIRTALTGVEADTLPERVTAVGTFLDRRNGLDERIAYMNGWQKATAVMAFILVSFIMVFVVPAFKSVFMSFGGDLPPMTLLVITISDLFTEHWYIVLAILLLHFAIKRAVPAYRRAVSAIALRLPGIGRKQRLVGSASLLDAAVFLHSRGLSPQASLADAASGMRNAALRNAWEETAERLGNGSSFQTAIAANDYASRSLRAQVAVAPELTLDQLAPLAASQREGAIEFVRRYADKARLTTTIGFVLLVGFFVIAVYLPIFKLGSVV